MQVKDLMSSGVLTASPKTAVFRALALMKRKRFSCLVIVERGEPVGIITERDMVSLFESATQDPSVHLMPVQQFMSSPPVTIEEDATFFDALVIAKSRGVRHLPVVNASGSLVGIVTQTNLIDTYMSVIEEQRQAIESATLKRTRSLEDSNEQLRSLALEDSLLRIGNRRAMEVVLAHTQESAQRYGITYSIALFDVDHFKAYNDHSGHLAGDQALRDVAGFLRRSIRGADRIYRYGGDEVLILLPETTPKEAVTMAKRLVEGTATLGISHPASELGVLTVSCGVGSWPSLEPKFEEKGWQAVVECADRALYNAKARGGNQVMLSNGGTGDIMQTPGLSAS